MRTSKGQRPEVQSAIVWLDGAARLSGASPLRAGVDLERREFVIELPDGRRVMLPLTAARELIMAGNAANGHGAVDPG